MKNFLIRLLGGATAEEFQTERRRHRETFDYMKEHYVKANSSLTARISSLETQLELRDKELKQHQGRTELVGFGVFKEAKTHTLGIVVNVGGKQMVLHVKHSLTGQASLLKQAVDLAKLTKVPAYEGDPASQQGARLVEAARQTS